MPIERGKLEDFLPIYHLNPDWKVAVNRADHEDSIVPPDIKADDFNIIPFKVLDNAIIVANNRWYKGFKLDWRGEWKSSPVK